MAAVRFQGAEQLREILRQERKNIALIALAMFAFPVLGAAISGDIARTTVCALVAAPCAVLMAAITIVASRSMRGAFGPAVARRVFAAWCALCFLFLVALLGLIALYMIYPNIDASLTGIGLLAAALACVGMAILGRVYRSGSAAITRKGSL